MLPLIGIIIDDWGRDWALLAIDAVSGKRFVSSA
jgi:hypothetical protein